MFFVFLLTGLVYCIDTGFVRCKGMCLYIFLIPYFCFYLDDVDEFLSYKMGGWVFISIHTFIIPWCLTIAHISYCPSLSQRFSFVYSFSIRSFLLFSGDR